MNLFFTFHGQSWCWVRTIGGSEVSVWIHFQDGLKGLHLPHFHQTTFCLLRTCDVQSTPTFIKSCIGFQEQTLQAPQNCSTQALIAQGRESLGQLSLHSTKHCNSNTASMMRKVTPMQRENIGLHPKHQSHLLLLSFENCPMSLIPTFTLEQPFSLLSLQAKNICHKCHDRIQTSSVVQLH